MFDIDVHSPFPTVRPQQREAVEFALDAFLNKGKKFVILEMGTGCGKSATGLTISRYLDSHESCASYILTTQKVLQDQYEGDFGPSTKNILRSIKSSSNYQCTHYCDQSCGESRRLLSSLGSRLIGTSFWNNCTKNCVYKNEKAAFLDSKVSITNFSYFLAETMYAGKLTPRDLLIIDEAHNVELELGKFVEVVFSEKFMNLIGCKFPKLRGDDEKQMQQAFDWIVKTYKPKLVKHIDAIQNQIEKTMSYDPNNKQLSELGRKYEILDKHICKVNRFIDGFDPTNWVMNFVQQQNKKLEFKPVDMSVFSEDMLFKFGKKVLLMSATIINKEVFCQTIGIDPNDAEFLSIPSPFKAENRPIHVLPVGKMSKSNIDTTLPEMAKIVKVLLDSHPDEKGVIHCVSFKVAKYLHDNIKDSRLLIHDSSNRDVILQDHLGSKEPTVLLSPSMTEGVDLADDASRFQILCKVPYPYLGDKVVSKRKDLNSKWYPFQTAKSVIQAMGRSVRSETDHAVSYILDSDWKMFYRFNGNMFPQEFKDALV